MENETKDIIEEVDKVDAEIATTYEILKSLKQKKNELINKLIEKVRN